jgi:hypothetical protein
MSKTRHLFHFPLFAALALLIVAPAAFAQSVDNDPGLIAELEAELLAEEQRAAFTASYACLVDIANGFDDCFDPVTVASYSSSSDERRVTVDLNNGFNWQSLNIRYETCNGSGWTWNVGDSPSNNGFSGDGGDTRHDAEAQALDGTLRVYKSDLGGSTLSCQFVGPQNPVGCITQQITVRNDYFAFDSNTASSFPIDVCGGSFLFDFPAYDEADSEDPNGLYEDKIYVGLNRVVANNFRNGDGIQRACIFLSTSTSPNPATIDSECGF